MWLQLRMKKHQIMKQIMKTKLCFNVLYIENTVPSKLHVVWAKQHFCLNRCN